MKATRQEIMIAYCKFIGRNFIDYPPTNFDKVPISFYEGFEVTE